MHPPRAWPAILGLILASCAPPQGLTVDVKTDYAPGEQFASVRTELSTAPFPDALVTGTVVTVPSSFGERYLEGVRVAEHPGLGPGTYFVRVSLVTVSGIVLASRSTEVRSQGRYALTTILSRSCEGVVCPMAGDPMRTECSGGVCVDPRCSPETPEACVAGCSAASDCTSDPRAMTECGSASCVDGVCLFAPTDARCAAGARCRGTDLTCGPPIDAGPSDAGARDAGPPEDTQTVPLDSGGPSGPYAPIAPATNSVWTVRDSPSRPVTIGASDADGDIASYEVRTGGPLRGSVSFDGDTFVFTPIPGAEGSDAFTIRISDTGGRFVDQVVSVSIVAVPSPTDWRYFAVDGESVTLGGMGEVLGTNGSQEIVLAEVPGVVRFDASFNRGNDAVRLTGNAADWLVAGTLGNATLTDGSTFAQIPGGPMGLALAFDDGVRTLRIVGSSTLELGSQTITEVYLPITAPADGSSPFAIEPAARGRLLMQDGGHSAVVGGSMDLYGTSALETIVLLRGDIRFDPSFNRGGDTIVFPSAAATFEASTSGSSVVVANGGLSTVIPFGTVGASLVFTDATYSLRTDGLNALIGAQIIGTTPAPLSSP